MSPSRSDVNASREPSGDHRGSASRFFPAVNRRGGVEPSTAASQIVLRYAFAFSSMLQTT